MPISYLTTSGTSCISTESIFSPLEMTIFTHAKIEKVIFNPPATIILWSDKTKTVVKCQEGDTFDKELGMAMAITKKYFGNKANFNNEFKKWVYDKRNK